MQVRITKKTLITFLAVLIALLISVDLYTYYSSYPHVLEVDGKFSATDVTIDRPMDNSITVASSFRFKTLLIDDAFNVTILATAGWRTTRLTIYNASTQAYPIICDDALFEANGTVSIHIREPRIFVIGPLNPSASILTGGADKVIFNAEGGKGLLMQNMTFARMPFSRGNVTVDLQVAGGDISATYSASSFDVDNKDGMIGIHLEMQVSVEAQIVAEGKFAVESDAFSSVRVDFWSSPINGYFTSSNGFLAYANKPPEFFRSQDLNVTGFVGQIALFEAQIPHEISIVGYADKIQVGEIDLTRPNPIRDLAQTLTIYSTLIFLLLGISLSVLVEMCRDRIRAGRRTNV